MRNFRNARSWRGAALVGLLALAGAAFAHSTNSAGEHPGVLRHDEVIEEARAFMESYARDLLTGDRAAIAARYDRTGAYRMGNGQKEFDPYEAIVAIYQGPAWSPPAAFEWRDLSFEVLGPDAVVVAGRFHWSLPGVATPILMSYTGLFRRQDGVLRIRLEDESADPSTLPMAPVSEDPNP